LNSKDMVGKGGKNGLPVTVVKEVNEEEELDMN
jgi:hypothetical protein